MDIRIVKSPMPIKELEKMASDQFGGVVKAVVDVAEEIMAVGGELHSDEEVLLTEECSSKRENLWGINIHPEKNGAGMIEFDSMINVKPAFGNRSRDVEDSKTKERIRNIVEKLITR